MTFRDDPDASVINSRIVYVDINVEDRMVLTDGVAIAMPSNRRSVFWAV